MKIKISDRFIPLPLQSENRDLLNVQPPQELYSKVLFHELFPVEEQPRILDFWEPKKFTPYIPRQSKQAIPEPFPLHTRILDAPYLSQDFYLHPLTSAGATMFVILGKDIYSQDFLTDKIKKLSIQEADGSLPQSLDCLPKNNILSYSNNKQQVVQYYTDQDRHVRRVTFPNAINVIRHHETDLFAGLVDGNILHYDLRVKANLIALNDSSNLKVCNIAFHKNLMAAGFNDNVVKIWDIRKTEETIANFDQFKAAVRALCWHPSGTLVAGGGSADKTIKILDVNHSKELFSVDTGAQVTNLHLNSQGNELISTHGSGEKQQNTCRIWKLDENQLNVQSVSNQMVDRFLFSTMAREDTTLITGHAEMLHIWENIFTKQPVEKVKEPFTFEIR